MEKLSLGDVGTPISEEKGWAKRHIGLGIKVIMVIKAPNKNVLATTDYPKIMTVKKCKAIKAFMKRNRQNDPTN